MHSFTFLVKKIKPVQYVSKLIKTKKFFNHAKKSTKIILIV